MQVGSPEPLHRALVSALTELSALGQAADALIRVGAAPTFNASTGERSQQAWLLWASKDPKLDQLKVLTELVSIFMRCEPSVDQPSYNKWVMHRRDIFHQLGESGLSLYAGRVDRTHDLVSKAGFDNNVLMNEDLRLQNFFGGEDEGGRRDLPLRVMGWVLGAMSLLNLIQDLNWIAISTKLKVWFDAYAKLAHAVGTFLFEWIKIAWFSISGMEHHTLILAALFTTSFLRVHYLSARRRRANASAILRQAWTLVAFIFGPPFLTCLLLSDPWGAGIGSSVVILELLVALFIGLDDRFFPSRATMVVEIAGVTAILLLLIALNNSLQ